MDWLFPKKCLGCGKVGFYLCLKCRKNVKIAGANYKDKRIEGRISLFKYDGVIRELIRMIKFEFVSDAVGEIGNWMVEVLEKDYPNIVETWKKDKYEIVPVPLHWRRENWRGFNQSIELARVIGKKLNIKVLEDVIVRKKNTKSQSTQLKHQRGINVRQAFKINGEIPSKIIIFDDVWTSGETIKSMVSVIPQKTKIWVLALAAGK